MQIRCNFIYNHFTNLKQKQTMHQNVSSLITEPQLPQSLPSHQILTLSALKNDILSKMQYIDVLNMTYKQKSEMSFLRTFSRIMEQLSEQLKNAVQAYQNIDEEIQQDPKCVMLRKQAEFYRLEREVMEENYEEQLVKLREVKEKNAMLKRKRNELKRKSVVQQERIMEFHGKNRSLSMRLNNMSLNEDGHKKVTESTKFPSSSYQTRIFSFNSQNRKSFFDEQNTYTKQHPHTNIPKKSKKSITEERTKTYSSQNPSFRIVGNYLQ